MRAKFVNESDISSVKIEDIIDKEMIDRILMDSYQEELHQYNYAYEHNLTPEDLPEDFSESKEFRNWVKYELEILYDDVVSKFEDEIINGNTISIWRVITVNKNWINELESNKIKRLGIYWSWDKETAEPHWGYDNEKIPVLLESDININYIDWIETIKLNMIHEEEKEIRLFKNTPIQLKSIEVNGEKIDISNIKNKIFKA